MKKSLDFANSCVKPSAPHSPYARYGSFAVLGLSLDFIKTKKIFFVILALVLGLSFFVAIPVFAVPEEDNNSNEDLQVLEKSVKTNCENIKSQIRRMQVSDANMRVALGRSYDTIYHDLMISFNARAELNGRRNPELLLITNDFAKFVGYFRRSYITYDNDVRRVLAIDCETKPIEFYAGIERLRLLRAGVRSNSDELVSLTSQFRAEVVKMRTTQSIFDLNNNDDFVDEGADHHE